MTYVQEGAIANISTRQLKSNQDDFTDTTQPTEHVWTWVSAVDISLHTSKLLAAGYFLIAFLSFASPRVGLTSATTVASKIRL